jgi:hypothetical protein
MILRDAHGRLWIINRKDYKNDASYYEKIHEILSTFKRGHPSERNSPTSKHFSDDIECEDEDE